MTLINSRSRLGTKNTLKSWDKTGFSVRKAEACVPAEKGAARSQYASVSPAGDKLLKATRISDPENNELHGNRENGKLAANLNMKDLE